MSHDRTGAHLQRNFDHYGTGIDRHTGSLQNEAGSARQRNSTFAAEREAATGPATGISAALATLERYTRELGTALVAFERHIERQIERARERQRSRGPRMGR